MTNTIANRTIPGTKPEWKTRREQELQTLESLRRPLLIRVANRLRGDRIPAHNHSWGQLLYARHGLMTADTDDDTWVIPSHRAVWIPEGIDHEVRFLRATRMHNVYLSPHSSVELPNHCCMVGISPLLRELIHEASRFPVLYDETGPHGRLVATLLDQLGTMQQAGIHLPWPNGRQLQNITRHLQENPGDNCTLESWAVKLGASSRTLNRKFRQETGMSFGEWRQQARLLAALALLAEETPVNIVADKLGYNNQSAFISMFRKATGKTPARYFRDE